jgi:hypothetical protein
LPAQATTANPGAANPVATNPVATPAADTPPADNPAAATATLPPLPDAGNATPTTIVVAATVSTKATAKPKPTKAPKTIPATTITTANGPDAVVVVNPADFSVDATATAASGTPSGQRPAASSVPPTSTKASKAPKAAKTTSSVVSVPARAATTPTLGDTNAVEAKRDATSSKPAASAKPTSPPAATGSAEIVFETALPASDTQAPASTKKSGKPGSKATTSTTAPKNNPTAKPDPALTTSGLPVVPAAPVATVAIPPTLPESTLPDPTLPPTVAPTTTKRPKPTTTTTTILLSPDTVPASDIEVSVEGADGSAVQSGQTGNADPSTTRKKRPSITDALEGTTTAPNTSAPTATKPTALSNPVATSTVSTVASTTPQDLSRVRTLPTAVTVNPENPAGTNSSVGNAAGTDPSGTDPSDTKPAVTKPSVPDRPRTEAEIVSGTDADSPDAGTPSAIGSSSTPQASASSLKAGRLRGPLNVAGAGALAALLLGLTGVFASLRAPITAFARQRLLSGFGLGLALAILTIAAIAIARELLNAPRSWPRVALKGLGFAALTAFAFVRRRSMKRGLSVVSEALPSAKNVRVHSSGDGVAASRELDEQLPKSLRLGDATGRRAKGRHIPELVRRLRKASLVEATFGAVALLVATALLFV